MQPPRTAVAVLAVSLLVAGCSDTTRSVPATAAPPTQASSTAEPNRHGAPRVNHPLDATAYLSQPCAALSLRQRQTLAVPGEGEADTSGAIGSRAPSCRWSNLDTGADGESVGVAFLKGNRHGLVDLYRGNATRPEAYWEPTTVEGYPGVFHDGVDSRSAGQCGVTVGLTEALAMSVRETGPLGARSCERVKDIAAAVIQTVTG